MNRKQTIRKQIEAYYILLAKKQRKEFARTKNPK